MDGVAYDGMARIVQIKSELCGDSSTACVKGKLSLEISHPAKDISLFSCKEVSSFLTVFCRHNAKETGGCTVGFACFILKSSEMQEMCTASCLDQIKSMCTKREIRHIKYQNIKG